MRFHFNAFSGSSERKLQTKTDSKTWTSGLSQWIARREPLACPNGQQYVNLCLVPMDSKTRTSGLSRNVTRLEPILFLSVGLRWVGECYGVTPDTRHQLLEVVNTAVFGIRKLQVVYSGIMTGCMRAMGTLNKWCNNLERKCCKRTKWWIGLGFLWYSYVIFFIWPVFPCLN